MTDSEKPEQETQGDCYAEGERGFMEWNQSLRGRALRPVLEFLNENDITPNTLTLFSLLAGLLAALALPFLKILGLVLLLVHVLLDGIDGPLARSTGTASKKGSFTDTASDQIVVFAVMLALVSMNAAGAAAAMVYVFSYTLVVGFSIIRNRLNIPYSWLIRPRFIVYAWIPVSFWLAPLWTLDFLLWSCNVLLVAKVVTGFLKIREKI
ncbi:MAG: CDP-alcohol phosphatidyltransferase family protein [Alphaproteobacteria bacterium]|nr:CDP-alcohol phosphatidyltransferase family protein [Alphaproteobacteria bacterium]MBP7759196.1 CDP-alcohol phosphatidyltransferase family protein [Alphaproteobacteria bacterium]MBP7762606.1 CDP-alcohol phosphatidyltransferase family protein [Alphaproteobacteria bacterium]MBP7905094.1 CDP-alcohol phosphatidyltransferase family protein [Alphaproteobacteria bacterium]